MLRRVSLRQYEYAVAVAEAGSVTAAAERLHVAQPSVSQQIRALEKDLGVALFARTPGGLVPTMAGRAFLREAENAVDAARRARSVARACSDSLVGELVIVAEAGLGMCQLPRAIGALRRAFDGLTVTVREEADGEVLDRLMRSGQADIALATRPVPDCPQRVVIGDEAYVAVLAPGHRLLTYDAVPLGELAREPWIALGEGSAVATVVKRAFAAAGLAVTTVARASQLATATRLAVEGFGTTVVPRAAVPVGYEHLIRPVDPHVTHPVVLSARSRTGPAERMLFSELGAQAWCLAAESVDSLPG